MVDDRIYISCPCLTVLELLSTPRLMVISPMTHNSFIAIVSLQCAINHQQQHQQLLRAR